MTGLSSSSTKKTHDEHEKDGTQTSDAKSVKPSPPRHPAVKRNAFSELMSPKPSKSTKAATSDFNSRPESEPRPISAPSNPANSAKSNFYVRNANRAATDPRSGLLAYIQNPTSFPSSTVLRVTSDTVLIRDLYPKATIHLLLLPRSPSHYNLHPHDAFTDPTFLSLMQREAASAAALAASELSRLLSHYSQSDQARTKAMDRSPPPSPSSLPPGRNYLEDLRIGVHAHPSMAHLHIHIISRDMHSPALKHRKHYNSFNTDFFIPLADYPLAETDPRRQTAFQNANLKRDFMCWRCGEGFGNKFSKLKDHLETEWKEWRAE